MVEPYIVKGLIEQKLPQPRDFKVPKDSKISFLFGAQPRNSQKIDIQSTPAL